MFNIIMALIGVAIALPHHKRIESIPGYPKWTNFDMYSGFVEIGETTKHIHYLFLTS